MTRVLLLNPPPVDGVRYTREGRCQERESVLGTVKPPLTLATIGALLRQHGHSVRLIDATILDLSDAKIISTLEEDAFHPDVIVLATSTPTIIADMRVGRSLKEHFGSLLVATGPHTSGIPRETLQEFPWLDVAVVGEPEMAVLRIATNPDCSSFGGIDGVCYREGDQLTINPNPARVERVDELPSPAWDLVPIGGYRLPILNEPYVLVETSRGCPPACDFCVVTLVHGKAFRQRPTGKIVDEIQENYRRYGIRYFYLWGDTVTLGRRFLEEFAEQIKQRRLPIHWLGNTRVDTLASYEFVQTLKDSGCWMLSVGVESGDDSVRSTMSKKFDRARIKQAFSWLRQAGIFSFAFFILGYLGENKETMEKTIDFAIQADPDFAAFYPAVPYPGTPFYRECVKRGWVKTHDWSKYDYSHYIIENHVLRPEIVLPLKTKAYRKFYMRPKVIARDLKMLQSVDAIRQIRRWGYELLKNGGVEK